MRTSKAIRFISIFLVLMLVVGYLPSSGFQPIQKTFSLLAVESSDDYNEDNASGSHNNTNSGTAKNPNAIIQGVDFNFGNFYEINSGSTNLNQRGMFIGETDNYFYILDSVKLKDSATCYHTIGYAINAGKINYLTEDPVTRKEKDFFTAVASESDCTNAVKDLLNKKGAPRNVKVIAPTNEGDNNKTFPEIKYNDPSNKDITIVVNLHSYNKYDLMNEINVGNRSDKLTWTTGKRQDGTPCMKATVYLHGIQALQHNDKVSSIYAKDSYLPNILAQMTNFSPESKQDITRYHNIPMYVIGGNDTYSVIDLSNNNKILEYGEMPKNSRNETTNIISFTKSGKIKSGDKELSIVGGVMVPKGRYNESAIYSDYLVNEVHNSIFTQKPCTFAAYTDAARNWKSYSKTVYKDMPEYSVTGNSLSNNSTSQDINKYGYFPVGVTTDSSLTFSATSTPASSKVYFHAYIFVNTSKDDTGNVVGYNDETGEKLFTATLDIQKKAKEVFESKYKTDYKGIDTKDLVPGDRRDIIKEQLTYTFPEEVADKKTSQNLAFCGGDFKTNTTLTKDIAETFARVQAGGKVLERGAVYTEPKITLHQYLSITPYWETDKDKAHGAKPVYYTYTIENNEDPILYRADYKTTGEVNVLYYAKEDGHLIKREKVPKKSKHVLIDTIQSNGKTYYTKQVSCKIKKDPEVDIKETATRKSPIMTSEDLAVTQGTTLVTPAKATAADEYIVRAECSTEPPTDKQIGGKYTIRSQYLAEEPFVYSTELKAVAEDIQPGPTQTHTYTINDKKHTCTVRESISWQTYNFDWKDNPFDILNPNNHIFTDRGTKSTNLTHINDLTASGGRTISTTLNLQFYTHRVDVDGVCPVFAKFMNDKNSETLKFMKSHGMIDLANEGLEPNKAYNAQGGKAYGYVSITPGTKTTHNRRGTKTKTHSSCGANKSSTSVTANTEYYTHGQNALEITAEPSIVGTALPVGSVISSKTGTAVSQSIVIRQTGANAIAFYPAYKMFLGHYNAFVLGKEQRKLKAVNVAQIDNLNTTRLVKVASTYSRDQKDTNQLNIKGGYQYAVSQTQPAEFKVTTYIVVPKFGYVKDADKIRKELLKGHEDLVKQFIAPQNFIYATNLPEAYNASSPNEFKKQNPYKKSGDNVQKSRLPQPTVTVTTTNAQSTTLSLSSVDSLYQVDNANRLKAQLQKKDWYQEEFDGFEVVKQVTTIKAVAQPVKAVNFLRNGGETANDLAKPAVNIPAGRFGIEFIFNKNQLTFMGGKHDVLLATQPFLFSVRGTAYDDRS